MLDQLGINAVEEQVYRTLLRLRQASLAELATAAGVSGARVRRALAELARVGLVTRGGSSSRFIPAPPDVAVEALIAQRTEELRRARLAAADLLEEYRRGSPPGRAAELIEVVTGRDAIHQRSVQLVHSARHEVLMFDKPPYIGQLDNTLEFESLARGIRWRAVYAPESLRLPDRVEQVHALQRAGERGRIAPGLPLKLAVADNRLALLPLTTDHDEQEMAVLVHPCSLLTTVITLFELYWARGMPAGTGDRAAPADEETGHQHPDDALLLTLLAAGATDEAIARQLGVSLRTARRRLAALMRANGVQTRFQLGLVAGRRGLA